MELQLTFQIAKSILTRPEWLLTFAPPGLHWSAKCSVFVIAFRAIVLMIQWVPTCLVNVRSWPATVAKVSFIS